MIRSAIVGSNGWRDSEKKSVSVDNEQLGLESHLIDLIVVARSGLRKMWGPIYFSVPIHQKHLIELNWSGFKSDFTIFLIYILNKLSNSGAETKMQSSLNIYYYYLLSSLYAVV